MHNFYSNKYILACRKFMYTLIRKIYYHLYKLLRGQCMISLKLGWGQFFPFQNVGLTLINMKILDCLEWLSFSKSLAFIIGHFCPNCSSFLYHWIGGCHEWSGPPPPHPTPMHCTHGLYVFQWDMSCSKQNLLYTE